jgi:hypothetical protein
MSLDPRLTTAFEAENGFALEPSLVVLALMGSHSHGTYLPPDTPDGLDDVDYMGFVVPPLDFHLGLPRWEHWGLQFEELDVVLYSLEKAFRLLLKCNPNIVGVLWLHEEHYVFRHPLFDRLKASRDLFASRLAADVFGGYAFSQLKKMEAFDLERMAEYERLTALVEAHGDPGDVLKADARGLKQLAFEWREPVEALTRFCKLHREHFSGYMGAKRKAMVRRYGYDTKNAAHMVRLLRLGLEFLETGRLQVFRTTDADELKAIKRGGWTLEQVKAEAARLFERMEAVKAASPLPEHPDERAANRLLVEMQGAMLGLNLRNATE